MSISVLIVEDNPLTSQDLSEMLNENGFHVEGICYSGEDALLKIPSSLPDVLLVDIQLKGKMTGIDLVNALKSEIPVVYLTANSDRETVEKVLETHPASFLTKPFNEREVLVAIELAASRLVTSRGQSTEPLPFVFLKAGKTFDKVDCSDIFYIQADGSYCKVFTQDKEYTITGNLNSVSSGFSNPEFIRVHRSYVVNVNKIESLDHDYLRVNGKDISVGRTYKEELRAILRRFT